MMIVILIVVVIVMGGIKWYDGNKSVEINNHIAGGIISSQSGVSYMPSILEMQGEVNFRVQPIYLGTFSLIKDPESRIARSVPFEDYHYDLVQMMLAKEDQQQETFLGIVNHNLSSKTYFDENHNLPSDAYQLHIYYKDTQLNPIYIKLENGDYFIGPCENEEEGRELARQLIEGTYESYLLELNQ